MTRYLRTVNGHTMTVHAPHCQGAGQGGAGWVRRGGAGARAGRGNLRDG